MTRAERLQELRDAALDVLGSTSRVRDALVADSNRSAATVAIVAAAQEAVEAAGRVVSGLDARIRVVDDVVEQAAWWNEDAEHGTVNLGGGRRDTDVGYT